MAIKEYALPRSNFRPIYKKPVRLPRDFVQPSKAAAKETPALPLAEGQAPIAAQSRSPRYDAGSIMGVISSLRSPGEANPTFDPNKPIGGENIPYKGTSGVGGLFSRIFGNRANELNVEAQQQQAAEMRDKALRAEERQARNEDLANEIRLREQGPAKRFEITQAAAEKAEANRVAAENKRLELEGKRVGLTERQIEDARLDRIARLQAEKEERDIRIEDMRTRNALADAAFGISQAKANQLSMTGLPGGSLAVMDPRSGAISIVNPGTVGYGEKFPGTAPTTRQVYPQPKAPVNTGGGQVDRTTGAATGGTTPAAEAPVNTALFPTMGRALSETAGEAVSTVTDPLRAMGTEAYKALFSSGAQQDPEVLKRIKEREARRAATQPRFGVPMSQFGRGF